MPKLQINLKGPLFPPGNTLQGIKRDALFCIACYNLSPATAMALMPRQGLAMQISSHFNMKAAERVGMLEPVPIWVNDTTYRPDYYPFEVRTRLVDILEAVRQGCPSCTLLERAISTLCPRSVSFNDPLLEACLTFCSGRILLVMIYHEPLGDDSDSECSLDISGVMGFEHSRRPDRPCLEDIEIYTLPGKRSPWLTIGCSVPFLMKGDIYEGRIGGVVRHVAVNPGSQASFNLIKSWLDRCVNGHTSCREADSKVEHQLPRRVIEVGSDDNATIRLHEHDDRLGALGSHYIALSHCWGQKPLPRLTRDTLEKKKTNIPWQSLPRTFQDVILVVRGIGVKYVWIDSLCIIQDNKDDWETEAAKMSFIYEGALMVIAATASRDSNGGCLFEREPYVEIQATIQSSEPFSVFARKPCSHHAFLSSLEGGELRPVFESNELSPHDYPLFMRAWCFQERLLGTRILHFLRQEMVFECLEALDCECGTLNGYVENAMRQMRRGVRLDKLLDIRDLVSKEDEKRLRPRRLSAQGDPTLYEYLCNETWRRVVETYSQRQISFPEDTFPALSGLANRWSRMTGKRYLCGLWADDDLLVGLTWYTKDTARTEGRHTTYIAPSWSWASVKGGVCWPDYCPEDYFVKVDSQSSGCVYSGPDAFGRITLGWVVITGNVMSVTLELSTSGKIFLNKNGFRYGFSTDDDISCRKLAGKQVVCLHYTTTRFQGLDRAIILAPVELSEDINGIPENIKQCGEIYRRIGIGNCPWAWNTKEDSRPATVIIV